MPVMTNAHALVIGIADYRHINRLPHVKDAQDMATLLTDPAYCGYPPANVQLLQDEEATQAVIRQGLTDLARRTDADSTAFIYFSGHGGQIESGLHAGEYLLPVDTVYPYPTEDLARTAISGDRVHRSAQPDQGPQGCGRLRLLPLRHRARQPGGRRCSPTPS